MTNINNDIIFKAIGEIDIDLLEEFDEFDTITNIEIIPIKKKKIKSTIKKYAISSLAVASIFIIMINISPIFAHACKSIPLLDKLAKAVNFSYSLTRAVEEEFIQIIGQSKTQDNITINLQHLIVDQKEVNIFYTLEGDTDYKYMVTPEILTSNSGSIKFSSDVGNIENPDDLRSISIEFFYEIPAKLLLNLQIEKVLKSDIDSMIIEDSLFNDDMYIPEYYTKIPFFLEFASHYTEQSRTHEINKTIQINGQNITIGNLEIYPTQMQLEIIEDENNSKKLQSLEYYLLDENRELLESNRTGITISRSTTDANASTYHMESDFFNNSESITLVITHARWLDKDFTPIKFDLKNNKSEWLHENETFSCELTPQGYILYFDTPSNDDDNYQKWGMSYYDENENKISINSFASYNHEIEKDGEIINVSRDSFALSNYFEDYVWLMPSYDYITQENIEVLLY